jgi:hypothetical protein
LIAVQETIDWAAAWRKAGIGKACGRWIEGGHGLSLDRDRSTDEALETIKGTEVESCSVTN